MGKIVAIGGGELRQNETNSIDNFIVSLCEEKNPKLLFIPTASNDARGYIELIKNYFGDKGCQVSSLNLMTEKYQDKEIENLIVNSNIIYVGGGDTLTMMKKWQELNINNYLKKAYQRGTVLSGISAGSICWFIYGYSDSEAFTGKEDWSYSCVKGLGLIKASHSPHYDEQDRRGYDDMILGDNLSGIALENQTALVEEDGKYYIIKDNPNKKAFILKNEDGNLIKKELKEKEVFEL